MHFKFDITLTDSDYLDYNLFHQNKSPYGKKQINSMGWLLLGIFVGIMFIALFVGGFSKDSFINTIPIVISFVLIRVFLKKILSLSTKKYVKLLKKTGKMGYSPKSVLEFYDDYFVEITPDEKTERKYSALERISVVENKVVYLHVNNVMAYILPMSAFESLEQYYFFMSFIKTKCSAIDSYK